MSARTWNRWPAVVGCIVASLMLMPSTAQAQAIGYGLVGPAGYGGWFGGGLAWHAAGGGEFLVKGVAGGAAEIGIFGNSSSLAWLTSFNGVAHLAKPPARTSPYITGGYSQLSNGEGTNHMLNFGIGADFQASDHAGTRVEFRDHIRNDVRGAVHYFSIRVGIMFK